MLAVPGTFSKRCALVALHSTWPRSADQRIGHLVLDDLRPSTSPTMKLRHGHIESRQLRWRKIEQDLEARFIVCKCNRDPVNVRDRRNQRQSEPAACS